MIIETVDEADVDRPIWKVGAGDEVRTRDMQLGRLPLCQLSYSCARNAVRRSPQSSFDDLASEGTAHKTIVYANAGPVLQRLPQNDL